MCVEMIMGLRSGMKENLIIPIIMALVAYIKARKKVPVAFMLAGALFFINILTPFMTAYRQKAWYGGTNFSESFRYGLEAVFMAREEREVMDLEVSGISRLADSTSMALLCEEKVREGEIRNTFDSPLDYLARFVPRFLWPDKPIVDYNKIGRDLGVLHENDYSTSIGITLLAGLIMGGGFYSVMLGFLFIGILLRTYWAWLMERSGDNILAFVIYFNIMYTWIRDADLMVTLHANLSFLVYAYFLLGFIKKHSKRSA